MPGYRFDRVHLAPSPAPSVWDLTRGVTGAFRRVGEHDLVHVHGEVAGGLILPLLATRPSIVTLHGLHLARRLSGLPEKGAALNLRAVLRAADRTICVSEAEHDILAGVVGVAAARRAVVVRNSVRLPAGASGTERAEVRAELGTADSEPLAIWVGSLDERKDPLTAIRAAEAAGVALLVVGDGPLRSQVEQAGRDSTRILGHRDDVPRLLAAADIFVSTSRREGLSLSLLEAMSHGLAAVVTDLHENTEATGDAGIAYGSEDGLVAALRRIADNESERAALGERARQRIAERFGAEDMVARTRAVYEDVLT
jgi:glycosyltransferase involved in cell wall biosynthesis